MKKRLLTLMLVLGMSTAMLSGCGGSSDEKQEENSSSAEQEEAGNTEEDEKDKEKEELTNQIREALEKHVQENLWGANSKTVEVDVNGQEKETANSEKTMDNEKQIIMFLYHFETNDQTSYYTKEEDKVYRYDEGYTQNGDKIFVKIPGEEDDNAYYETEAKGSDLPFESTQIKEMLDYDITNEGEDGDTVKIKVVEQYKLNTDKIFTKVTKESVMEDRGWTEDDIKGVEGASEAIDAYVAENEENIAKNKEHVYEATYYYWLTKDGNELVKSECRQEPTIAEYKEQDKLWDIQAKIEGYTLEDNEEEKAEAKEYIITTEYVTGDECAPIDNFPEDAKEITREQWMNGEY